MDGPVITSLTESLTMNAGASTYTRGHHRRPLEKTYQWSHGADTLIGQTSATLNLTNLQSSDLRQLPREDHKLVRQKPSATSSQSPSMLVGPTATHERTTATKANQTLGWKPKKAQERTPNTLPATTSQGEALNWKVSGAGGFPIKAGKLSCSKSTGRRPSSWSPRLQQLPPLMPSLRALKRKVG